MRNLYMAALAVVALGGMLGPRAVHAQTLTTMYRFGGTDGAAPVWKLVTDGQGNLYGTTTGGGPYVSENNPSGLGTIYKFTPSTRAFETLHNFAGGTDGATPSAGLTYDKNSGVLYGTTAHGGLTNSICSQGCGTLFSLNATTGAYRTLYMFSGGEDEEYPSAALTLGSDGIFYGTTFGTGIVGKVCIQQSACGTVFKYDPSNGSFATIHTFAFSDGAVPGRVPLVSGKAGKLFGTTAAGGGVEPLNYPGGLGVVFRIDPATNAFTVLHRFSEPTIPIGLAVDPDKNLYVTAEEGGVNGTGAIIKMVPNVGGPYSISTLFSFDPSNNNVSGETPVASLTFDSKKNIFYGVTYAGGAGGFGTMYDIDPNSGAFSLLHSFTGGSDGGTLDDSILVNLGRLYGGTRGARSKPVPPECAGLDGCGTIFRLPRF